MARAYGRLLLRRWTRAAGVSPKCPHRRPFSSLLGTAAATSGGSYVSPFRHLLRPAYRVAILPGLRRYSTFETSSSSSGADKAFERICIQGIAPKPQPLVPDDSIEAELTAEPVEESRDDEVTCREAEGGVWDDKAAILEQGEACSIRAEESEVEKEAWRLLNKAVVSYCGRPIGTVAANDVSLVANQLNYDQVFIRDFVPSAITFLLKGESEIVRNFILHTLQLQNCRN